MMTEQRPSRAKDQDVYSPAEVHKVLQILYRRDWVVPVCFGALVVWIVGFLLFGTIPITAKGNAIFITRDTVIPFQSTATGQIAKWQVKVGDTVRKGQILALLDQPLIEKQLVQTRQQLQDMQERNRLVFSLTETQTQLERATITQKRRVLQERIAVLKRQIEQSKALAKANRTENLRSLAQQRQNLQAVHDLEKKRMDELKLELTRTEELRTERLRSADEVVNARQSYSDQVTRVLDLNAQLLQSSLAKLKADESELQSANRIKEREDAVADLVVQLEGLVNQEVQLDKAQTEARAAMDLQTGEIQRLVEQLSKQLQENREIRSEHDGRVLELTTGEGKVITRGQRLGTLDVRSGPKPLEAVVYFKVEDGKRLKPGMKLRLTPATVTRERFGSVLARVTSVSRFAVSPEGAGKVVGNASVARTLTQDGHQIEVFAELQKDETTFSGYKWDTSSGPSIELTSGTIASALADIEERPPISFIIPILRY